MVAVWLKGVISGRSFCRACHRSYWFFRLSHISALVPKAADKRNAISAEIPLAPLSILDRVARVTPNRWAASVTVSSLRYSCSTKPGCAGLCISMFNLLVKRFFSDSFDSQPSRHLGLRNKKVRRQLPLTDTAQCPSTDCPLGLRPVNLCSRH